MEKSSDTPPVKQRGGFFRALGRLFVVMLILGLSGAVAYLLSDINRRRYRLEVQDASLMVQQGRFLPIGFEPFQPATETLQNAYAPIKVPANENFQRSEVFDDRADLDRALFALLAGWSRQQLDEETSGDFLLADRYLNRCEMLPGLSEEQRQELRGLRGDAAYRSGRQILRQITSELDRARDAFEQSILLGASRANDARQWIDEIERRRRAFADGKKVPGGGEPAAPRVGEKPMSANPDAPAGAPMDWEL